MSGDEDETFKRRPHVFRTSYVRSIYVMWLRSRLHVIHASHPVFGFVEPK